MNKLWGKHYNFLANWLWLTDVFMLHKNKERVLFKICLYKADTAFLSVISDYQSNSSVSSSANNFLVTFLCWKRKGNSAKINVQYLQTLFSWTLGISIFRRCNPPPCTECWADFRALVKQTQSNHKSVFKYSSGAGMVHGCLFLMEEVQVWCQGRWGAGSVPAPQQSQCLWVLMSALQTGCFPRAALMGTDCSPQPSSSRYLEMFVSLLVHMPASHYPWMSNTCCNQAAQVGKVS